MPSVPLSHAGSLPPRREVHCGDAIPWMQTHPGMPGTGVVTSLPDLSEVRLSLPVWRTWFHDAVRLTIRLVPDTGVAVFFQSDVRHDGQWIDKGSMVVRAAEDAGAHVVFHKIVCRFQPGRVSAGRPAYTHLIAVSRALRTEGGATIPDVIVDPGRLTWVRAMGIQAAAHAVRFARDHAAASSIIDPFCGVGTVLAVANALGLEAIGVEQSPGRCRRARELTLAPEELCRPA